MKKNRLRLTESQLHKVIKESVKRVLKEDVTFNEFANSKKIVQTIRMLITLLDECFRETPDYELSNGFTADEFIDDVLAPILLDFVSDRGNNGIEDEDLI